jgi:predicted DNA-binding transcriptional regulator YafY
MNRTDRLLAMVLELQAHGTRRAEDLAATFEISKRTVYRDVEALCEAGVPVVAVPGLGYRLMAGYFLPPVGFTPEEATLLLLGCGVMGQSFDAPLQAVATSAAQKIEAVLPARIRDDVQYLRASIAFLPPSAGLTPDGAARLGQIRRAIVEQRRIAFAYTSGKDTAPQHRQADPYGLVHLDSGWYVTAYCHLRQDVRHFRLDRMNDLAVAADTFQRPAAFHLTQRDPMAGRGLTVRALFAPALAARVRENPSFYQVAAEENDTGLLVTLRVRQAGDVAGWLLGWGASVRVLEPDSLRARLAAEAEKMLQIHQNPDSLLT